MKKVLPYSRQAIDQSDINSVIKVLKSDFLTQGPKVVDFEKKLAHYFKAKYVCAVNSATSALLLACKAVGLKKGDVAWTTPNTFVSSANCVLHCGAEIDFVDINSNDFNIDINLVEKKLKKTKKNKLPKVIIPIHFAGYPYDQKRLHKLSKKFNFKIIEDASHAIGAKFFGESVGSCKWSDITVFSFHPVKIISTGEGGAALTNNKKFYDKMNMLKTHGIIRDIKNLKKKIQSYWYYEQQDLGYNFRLSDIHAALGISQLKKINNFIKTRNNIAAKYKKLLKDLPVKFQKINNRIKSSFHLFIIKFVHKGNIKNYSKIFSYLRNKKIGVNLHYLPVHLHPLYKNMNLKFDYLKKSEEYSKAALSLPIYVGLKTRDQVHVIKNLKIALRKYK